MKIVDSFGRQCNTRNGFLKRKQVLVGVITCFREKADGISVFQNPSAHLEDLLIFAQIFFTVANAIHGQNTKNMQNSTNYFLFENIGTSQKNNLFFKIFVHQN